MKQLLAILAVAVPATAYAEARDTPENAVAGASMAIFFTQACADALPNEGIEKRGPKIAVAILKQAGADDVTIAEWLIKLPKGNVSNTVFTKADCRRYFDAMYALYPETAE